MTAPAHAKPVVSVLVTVHNRERFLAACLESILASDRFDFEIVVVDDCSSDSSVSIAESFAERDSRIRVVRNDANLGDYPNRMKAASLASGRYLKYVDSDDLIYPHTLSVMVGAMETNPDANLALSHSQPEADQPYPWKLTPHEAWTKEFLGDGCMGSGPTGAIIRRNAFIQAGGFRGWGVLSDTDLWYRLSAEAPLILLAPGLVWWRRHEAQEFTKDGARMAYLERGFDLVTSTLASPSSPLTPSETETALKRARQHHARRLLSLALRQRMPREAIRLIRTSGLTIPDLARGLAPYQ